MPGTTLRGNAGSWLILRAFASGAFSSVYLVKNARNGEKAVMKTEPDKKKGGLRLLRVECGLLRLLDAERLKAQQRGNKGFLAGFPQLLDAFEGWDNNYVVMTRLGQSLAHFLMHPDNASGTFSLKTCLMLGVQLLTRLEHLHATGILHRDIKPENILMGYEGVEQYRVYLVDFGISKRFLDRRGRHIPQEGGKPYVGTGHWVCIDALEFKTQSRRSDLESLAYLLIHLSTGRLPWIHLDQRDDTEYRRQLLAMKQDARDYPEDVLPRDTPECFESMLAYAHSLAFDAKPDYAGMREMLHSAATAAHLSLDARYDWADWEE